MSKRTHHHHTANRVTPAAAKRPKAEQGIATPHPWEFRARFRRHAFGWRSQPAITRVRQAVADSSSGALGSARVLERELGGV